MNTSLLRIAAPSVPDRMFASPELTGAAGAPGIGSLTEVLVSLAVVLAVIFVVAAIIRRMRGFTAGAAARIRVLGELSLGPKERAVLIDTGSVQMLIGVAPGRVSTLHVFAPGSLPLDSPAASTHAAATASPAMFRELMQRFGGAR